jgi:hypothetical protein
MEVVNELNARRRAPAPLPENAGEGEGDSSLLALMAADVAEATLNRKRSSS